jgi:hypothetical protein
VQSPEFKPRHQKKKKEKKERKSILDTIGLIFEYIGMEVSMKSRLEVLSSHDSIQCNPLLCKQLGRK